MELAQYRLLYFQPDPENGDRVCVGLVFEEPNGRSLVYDTEFSKVRCVAPQIDVDMVRFYCEDLRSSLQRDRDSEVALKRYSPQLTTSPRRSIAGPVIESVKERLLHRFATSSRSEQPRMEPSIAAEARKQAAELDLITRLEAELRQWTARDEPPASLLAEALAALRAVVTVQDGAFVSINEACALAGVCRRTLYNWMRDGYVDVGRSPSGRPRIALDSLRPLIMPKPR